MLLRVSGLQIQAGALYSTVELGKALSAYAPVESVTAPLSVDGGMRAYISVGVDGSCYVARRSDFTATVAAYGSMLYIY